VGAPVSVELAKRLRWEAEGLVVLDVARRAVRHPWASVEALTLTRGRWDVMELDVTSPWFDTVPLHVVADVAGGRTLKRRLDRDRLVRFGRHLTGVDPAAASRPVTRAFLEELAPMMGWSTLPGGGAVAWDGDEWEPPDPDLL
jgi:hypothetical protein